MPLLGGMFLNILLLGNGFDLHHRFPTRYLDFLHTVRFLMMHEGETFDTVGSVFSHESLCVLNENIKEAYLTHSSTYDSVILDSNDIQKIIELSPENCWLKYLMNSVSKNIKWIDFEKEIATVLSAFEHFFASKNQLFFHEKKLRINFSSCPEDSRAHYIIQQFNFFFDYESTKASRLFQLGDHTVKSQFLYENPIGSGCFFVNEEKIASQLFDSLMDLSEMLRIYLKNFVEAPARYMCDNGIKPMCNSYPKEGHVVSLNYTDTYEKFYNDFENVVAHVHGSTATKIVLGINSNERDEVGNIDTTFIGFKKYFQRVLFKTDDSFLRKLEGLRMTQKSAGEYSLYIIGHSLDVTDKEIITQLIDVSHRVTVLYHSQEAVKIYIRNLVEMYGKNGFDQIRTQKHLAFLPQAELIWNYPE